jgi:hypothetical protein
LPVWIGAGVRDDAEVLRSGSEEGLEAAAIVNRRVGVQGGSGGGEKRGRVAIDEAVPFELEDVELLHEGCDELGEEVFVGSRVVTGGESEGAKGGEEGSLEEDGGVEGGGEADVYDGELHEKWKGEEVRTVERDGEAYMGKAEGGDRCRAEKINGDWRVRRIRRGAHDFFASCSKSVDSSLPNSIN